METGELRSALLDALPGHAKKAAAQLPDAVVDSNSLSELGLSSMQILKFVMAAEEALGVEFSDSDLANLPNLPFSSIVSLAGRADSAASQAAAEG